MSDTTNNPQPSEPPTTGTGAGTTANRTEDVETTADAQISEPPTGGSGTGSSS